MKSLEYQVNTDPAIYRGDIRNGKVRGVIHHHQLAM